MMGRRMIKRIIMVLILVFAVSASQAQNDLQISKVFERFGRAKGCKMVELYNGNLKGYQLEVYKSLTYKNNGNAIEAYLKQDRANAKKVREVIENGQVTSGYYMMKPVKSGINRYILFRNGEKESGTVIYIEGSLSPEELMKMCTIVRKR